MSFDFHGVIPRRSFGRRHERGAAALRNLPLRNVRYRTDSPYAWRHPVQPGTLEKAGESMGNALEQSADKIEEIGDDIEDAVTDDSK